MRGNWAAPWIMAVARAGLMEVYPNHTFQPNAIVRRDPRYVPGVGRRQVDLLGRAHREAVRAVPLQQDGVAVEVGVGPHDVGVAGGIHGHVRIAADAVGHRIEGDRRRLSPRVEAPQVDVMEKLPDDDELAERRHGHAGRRAARQSHDDLVALGSSRGGEETGLDQAVGGGRGLIGPDDHEAPGGILGDVRLELRALSDLVHLKVRARRGRSGGHRGERGESEEQ